MAIIFLSYRGTDSPEACRVNDWLGWLMHRFRSEERLTRNEEKTVRTAESIALTEESIKRLSNTVDRYIRERNNGQ